MLNTDGTCIHHTVEYYVSQLKKNLLSIKCISEKDIKIFKDDQ